MDEAAATNNNGDVAGVGVLPGGNSSRAVDINELGQVVGTSTSAAGEHAFSWTKQTGIADLNSADSATLGFVFVEAHAVNARGQIVVTPDFARYRAGLLLSRSNKLSRVCGIYSRCANLVTSCTSIRPGLKNVAQLHSEFVGLVLQLIF